MPNLDTLVNKEMQNGLTQLYFNLRPCPTEDKTSLLNRMDEYVRLSRSPKTVKTRAFDELETTLKFDIYRIIEGDFYEEIKGSLALPTEALETYKSLSDEKRALFRKSLVAVSHKKRAFSHTLKQKFNTNERN